MASASTPKKKLSPTQERVLTALNATQGDVKAAAKRLKISPNGVYGHLRRIEEAGVDVSKYRTRASSNGTGSTRRAKPRHVSIDTHVKSAIATGEKRLKEIDKEIDSVIEQVHKLQKETETLKVEKEKTGLKVKALSQTLKVSE